jgi:hypothetical protein
VFESGGKYLEAALVIATTQLQVRSCGPLLRAASWGGVGLGVVGGRRSCAVYCARRVFARAHNGPTVAVGQGVAAHLLDISSDEMMSWTSVLGRGVKVRPPLRSRLGAAPPVEEGETWSMQHATHHGTQRGRRHAPRHAPRHAARAPAPSPRPCQPADSQAPSLRRRGLLYWHGCPCHLSLRWQRRSSSLLYPHARARAAVSRDPQGKHFTNPVISFDCLFTVVTLAVAHINRACDIVHPGCDTAGLVEAGRLLKQASGYFTFAVEKVVPLLRLNPRQPTPVECVPAVLTGLSIACLAQVRRSARPRTRAPVRRSGQLGDACLARFAGGFARPTAQSAGHVCVYVCVTSDFSPLPPLVCALVMRLTCRARACVLCALCGW